MRSSIVVADHDGETREHIASLLAENKYRVIAKASNGIEAKEAILALKPDVAFLDAHLAEIDGIALAKQIRRWLPKIGIVLVSASLEFASLAFEMEVIDYLVKPMPTDRIYTCFKKMDHFLNDTSEWGRKSKIIGFKHQGEIEFLQQDQIMMIASEKRQTKVFVNMNKKVKILKVRESLAELEWKMDPSLFIRTHRSFIININYLSKIYPSGQTYIATFTDMNEIAHISKNLIAKVYSQPGLVIIQ
ncbi:LytR/AlgR family response regulator transcription factor [Brevibacillus borstelensis]|uniref:LytR/AlgR family response regulator transcription factor n=1 Tax=Brevibacillus borstelensis TaxID=45462 RepID=UPI0030BC167B